jgi:hypothetical protein
MSNHSSTPLFCGQASARERARLVRVVVNEHRALLRSCHLAHLDERRQAKCNRRCSKCVRCLNDCCRVTKADLRIRSQDSSARTLKSQSIPSADLQLTNKRPRRYAGSNLQNPHCHRIVAGATPDNDVETISRDV